MLWKSEPGDIFGRKKKMSNFYLLLITIQLLRNYWLGRQRRYFRIVPRPCESYVFPPLFSPLCGWSRMLKEQPALPDYNYSKTWRHRDSSCRYQPGLQRTFVVEAGAAQPRSISLSASPLSVLIDHVWESILRGWPPSLPSSGHWMSRMGLTFMLHDLKLHSQRAFTFLQSFIKIPHQSGNGAKTSCPIKNEEFKNIFNMQILAKSTVKSPPWIHNRNKKCLLISKFPGVCLMSAAPVKSRNVKPCDSYWTPDPDQQLHWDWFWNNSVRQPASYTQCNWCNPVNLFSLYIFNSLVPAVIWLLQEYEPGLPCFLGNIWGTRFHLVFVWSSKYLGEAEDSFHLKCVFISLKQWGSEKGTGKQPAISFPPCLLDCFWPSVCAHAPSPLWAALLHRDFLVKSNSSNPMTKTLSIKLWHFSTWKK